MRLCNYVMAPGKWEHLLGLVNEIGKIDLLQRKIQIGEVPLENVSVKNRPAKCSAYQLNIAKFQKRSLTYQSI